MTGRIVFGDNLPVLRAMPDGSVPLIYLDPPFNTGKRQEHTRIKTARSATGDRSGFQGARYATVKIGTRAYADLFDDYLASLDPSAIALPLNEQRFSRTYIWY